MGHRSWLTEVENVDDCKEVFTSILNNEFGYGIAYALQIQDDCMFTKGSVVIAWAADGNSSVNDIKPLKYIASTILLEDFLEEHPQWHEEPKGPEQFGNMLDVEDIDIFLKSIK